MSRQSREYYLNQVLNRNSEILYREYPDGSLSVDGDKTALAFRDYLAKHLIPGASLDVGCGPQYKPVYIPNILSDWTGIDPLPGNWFKQRLVGDIENGLNGVVNCYFNIVFATSLDHCWNPSLALRNSCYRALEDRGRLFIWVGKCPSIRTRLVWWKETWKYRRIKMVNGLPFYVPLGCPDPFHKRYLTLKMIMKWTKGLYTLIDKQEHQNRNIFLCFEKR